ncbi:MAG TPA: UPF0182 family protein [Gemmatimonadales bacterium]|nr:UPF0182 family protein [Gemmatimonadales bacterium]
MSPRTRRLAALVLTIVVLLFAGRWTAGVLADRWWAAELSPAAAEAVTGWALLGFGLEATGLLFACAWFIGHLLLIYRAIGSVQVHRRLANLEIREAVNMQVLVWISVVGGLLLGVIAGRGAGEWAPDVVLSWSAKPYGAIDPVLGRDFTFYLTRLPVWRMLHQYLLLLTLLALGGATTLYVVIGAIRWQDRRPAINDHARFHLGALLVLLAFGLAWGYLLEPFEMVAGVKGTVHDGLFDFRHRVADLLAGMALAAAVLSFWWAARGRHAVLLSVWGLLAVSSILGHYVIPALIVGGRSSVLDTVTRRGLDQLAYGMVGVRDSTFVPRETTPDAPRPMALWTQSLAIAATSADSGRPVSADRAVITVGRRPRPVWLVLRDQGPLGGSLTVLLDDQASSAGFPVVYHEADSLRTPAGPPSLRLSTRASWPGRYQAIVDTTGPGVPVGKGLRRLALAWALQTGSLLGPGPAAQRAYWKLDPDERLSTLAPFATWGVPVPRFIGGELVWLVDGYLPSEGFPGSTRVTWRGESVGALRAGFVAVVSAETGKTSIYLRHSADELAKQWQLLFDALIHPASAIPAEVVRALAYPVELMEAQARVMEQPQWGLGQLPARPEEVGPLGPAEDARWKSDTSGVEAVIPYERERAVTAILQARMADGWETVSILRLDSLATLPAAPLLQTRWTKFPTFQQLKDSVEKAGARLEAGPIHYWPSPQGLGAVQVWYAERDGVDPVMLWVSLAIADRRGAGHDLEEAWQNLLGLSAPVISAGERGTRIFEARRYLEDADNALRRGDLEGFGRAWEGLKRTLRAP